MWNILIVIIIAVIIWLLNPLVHLNQKILPAGVDKKTINEVNQVKNETIQQVNQAREILRQEQNELAPEE